MGRIYKVYEPPSDSPVLVCVGCAVGLWGLSLLFSALPPLMCMPSGPRALRLAALGVSLSAALIGLLEFAQDASVAGTGLSLGFVVGYAISLFARSCARVHAKKHHYSHVATDDDDGDGVELTGDKPEEGEVLTNAKYTRPVIFCEGLALTSAIAYFSIVRGMLLGSGIYKFGGSRLEASVVCTVCQVSLAAGALSVTLTDAQFPLATSARLSLLFSFMGPLGIALGAYTREDGKSLVFQLFSAFVAGILLFQTAATKLPLEIRDSDDEWRHKGMTGSYWQSQIVRLGALFLGWFLMAAAHWPELVVDMDYPDQ